MADAKDTRRTDAQQLGIGCTVGAGGKVQIRLAGFRSGIGMDRLIDALLIQLINGVLDGLNLLTAKGISLEIYS